VRERRKDAASAWTGGGGSAGANIAFAKAENFGNLLGSAGSLGIREEEGPYLESLEAFSTGPP